MERALREFDFVERRERAKMDTTWTETPPTQPGRYRCRSIRSDDHTERVVYVDGQDLIFARPGEPHTAREAADVGCRFWWPIPLPAPPKRAGQYVVARDDGQEREGPDVTWSLSVEVKEEDGRFFARNTAGGLWMPVEDFPASRWSLRPV